MCVWVEDADKLEVNSKELNVVYYNQVVKSYIKEGSCLGLSGVKGQGKTFLIKVKRKMFEKEPSVVCFPSNQMTDTIDSSFVIDQSLYNYLCDYNVWVNLWKFAISGSILTSKEFKNFFNDAQLKDSTVKLLKMYNKRVEPSFLLKQLLYLNIKDLRVVLNDTGKLFDNLKDLHQSVCIFIDKLDQGFSQYAKNFNTDSRMPFRSRNASFWQYAQYGLAESAYDIYTNTNHHIKVFFTIRQEALIDSEIINKDKARNINAFISTLEYSKDDLKNMYYLYISNESSENLFSSSYVMTEPSKAFLGVETFPHGYIDSVYENVFDYIYRHTFKRPYDMMKICHALFLAVNNRKTIDPKTIRHIVNIESNKILEQYINELSIFLPYPIEEINRLLIMLPGNTLHKKMINSICCMHYVESDSMNIWNCNKNCSTCNNSQIFTLLYNIGLIGYYKQHAADDSPVICFENIGNRVLDLHTFILPHSEHYYLHPALSNKARDLRGSFGLPFIVNPVVIIGDECPVVKTNFSEIKKSINKFANQIKKERVFVSSTINDLKEERTVIRQILKDKGLHPIMSEYYDFDKNNAQKVHSHDLCLNEIKKCKNFVFIIGEEYGGIYAGDLYEDEKNEIIKASNNLIESPSISLMEFYVARKNKLKCFVFSSSNIEEKKYKGMLSKEINTELNFINHFKLIPQHAIKGNWIEWYSNIDNLANRINTCRFI